MDWSGNRKRRLKNAWTTVCDRLLVPELSVLHVTSDSEGVESSSRITRASVSIIRNGIDIPRDPPRLRPFLSEGGVRILYIGRLHEKKGIEQLIEALHRLSGTCEATLTIAGQGDDAYLHRLQGVVAARGLESRVQFAGFVGGPQKEILFSRTDVCVVPSYTENFAMVVAEALARGVPVIASKGTPWERIVEKRCGLWVDNTPEALSAAVREVVAMDLASMGQRGRAWMESEFAWSSVAAEMLDQYVRLAEVRRFA